MDDLPDNVNKATHVAKPKGVGAVGSVVLE